MHGIVEDPMDTLPIGPYRTVRLESGVEVPWYIIPFDRDGECSGPQTRNQLLEKLKAGSYTDVYLFSHGWNNAWKEATDRYNSFAEGFLGMREKFGLKTAPDYRPLLIGIYWPSTVLVTEKEAGPKILADAPDEDAIAEERLRIEELAAAVPAQRRQRFYELTQASEIDEKQARELADILQAVYAADDDELPDAGGLSPPEILQSWRQSGSISPPPTKETAGSVDDSDDSPEEAPVAGPQAAGGFRDTLIHLLPRDIVRVATVYQMKDRAGKVGAQGGKRLLEDVFKSFGGNVHLIGHSYGCKLLLSAVVTAELPRKVNSILLLQAAVSHLCFAGEVPGTGREGGYRRALDRVEKPIFCTFSAKDKPLHDLFHLGVRRKADLGEVRILAKSKEPPSRYAALGGYGPRHSGELLTELLLPPVTYTLNQKTRIYGLDATPDGARPRIANHGDVTNQYTWWALYQQLHGN
jgi:hypothetical protein